MSRVTPDETEAWRSPVQDTDTLDLFAPAPARSEVYAAGMVRRGDHDTSVAAAERVLPGVTELQARVLEVIAAHGTMTDGDLENLPEFAHYAYSTVRKRRSELFAQKKIRWTGERRDGMKVWALA